MLFWTLTLIFELAVVGLPFLSVFRFSGNRLLIKALEEQKSRLIQLTCHIFRRYNIKWHNHEMALGNSLFAVLHELNEVREEHVPVPLAEAVDVIGHLRKKQAQ